MTNQEIRAVALRQSAIDLNCTTEDLLQNENRIVRSVANAKARRYLRLPFSCNMVSYGRNIVASVSEETEQIVRDYLAHYSYVHCFETPNLHVLNDALQQIGLRACFMAEYFLPDVHLLKPLDCPYEMRMLYPTDFASLYLPQWSNALCEDRKQLDVLGVGAFDGGELVGFAGASADCESMWQIGIDVLPDYRRKGIASALTARLAGEILSRDIVPFYCAAWSNLPSVRNALRCGFRPAWVELTAKSVETVAEMNRNFAQNA